MCNNVKHYLNPIQMYKTPGQDADSGATYFEDSSLYWIKGLPLAYSDEAEIGEHDTSELPADEERFAYDSS